MPTKSRCSKGVPDSRRRVVRTSRVRMYVLRLWWQIRRASLRTLSRWTEEGAGELCICRHSTRLYTDTMPVPPNYPLTALPSCSREQISFSCILTIFRILPMPTVWGWVAPVCCCAGITLAHGHGPWLACNCS